MPPLSLHNLAAPAKTANKSRKRIGRGNGSGHGTYSGKGVKGQKARSGVSGLKLKGMRKRLLSIPKLRGFKSEYQAAATVNVGQFDNHFDDNAIISPKSLFRKNLILTPRFGVKILGEGETKKAFIVKKCSVSVQAKEKIEKAGGKIDNV